MKTLTPAQEKLLSQVRAGNGHPNGARLSTVLALVDAGLVSIDGGVERVGHGIGPKGARKGNRGFYFDWTAKAL